MSTRVIKLIKKVSVCGQRVIFTMSFTLPSSGLSRPEQKLAESSPGTSEGYVDYRLIRTCFFGHESVLA